LTYLDNKMLNPELSIIIVSYNSENELKNCLDSIFKTAGKNFEVIVVDNGSQDSSVAIIKSFKDTILIENGKNFGFARAVNQGLKTAKGNYCLLLNPDTKATRGAVRTLLICAKAQTDLAVIGPKLMNLDGTIQSSCFNLPTIKNAILEFWLGKKDKFGKYYPKFQKLTEIEAVVGAAMLIPKTALNDVGFLDERYFMYFEDLDWCRRANKIGLKIYYCPKAKFLHEHGASGKEIPQKTHKWLVESSKIYYGLVRYYLITFIILFGRKFISK
jgi:GT2 family glycosyltransferase